MNYQYTCDCQSNPNVPVLKPVPTSDSIYDLCGFYARLSKFENNRVIIHSMYPKGKVKDSRQVIDEDWI